MEKPVKAGELEQQHFFIRYAVLRQASTLIAAVDSRWRMLLTSRSEPSFFLKALLRSSISLLVHAILGIRPPAMEQGRGSDSHDRMDQRVMVAGTD
ncbi:MAG: hypothetical protein AAGA21_04005 [Pseudomonadota bacterium]